MKIGILGCGWLGERLAMNFRKNHHQVFVTNKNVEKSRKFENLGYHSFNLDFNQNDYPIEIKSLFNKMDMIVISVKVSKNINKLQQDKIFTNITYFLKGFSGKIIFFSSTGIYPNIEQIMDENSVQSNQLEPNIYSVEMILKKNLPQTNILRLSGLFGDNRRLKNFVTDYSKLKSPQSVVNYVHYIDIIHIVHKLLYANIYGETFNISAPIHPTKSEVWNRKSKPKLDEKIFKRIIDGSKLERKIDYEYIYKNPINFA